MSCFGLEEILTVFSLEKGKISTMEMAKDQFIV